MGKMRLASTVPSRAAVAAATLGRRMLTLRAKGRLAMNIDQALEILRKLCPNGDGAPEHSEQSPQWRACGRCDVCRAVARLEGVALGFLPKAEIRAVREGDANGVPGYQEDK